MVSNFLVFNELHLVLKKPFDPIGKRKYVNYLLLLAALLLSPSLFYKSYIRKLDFVIVCIRVLVFSVTICVTVLIARKLFKKGTSKQVRNIIIRRHMIYICLYLMLNLVFIITGISYYVGSLLSENVGFIVTSLFVEIFSCFGLAAARISEPYVFINIVRDVKRLFRCKKRDEISVYEEKPLQ